MFATPASARALIAFIAALSIATGSSFGTATGRENSVAAPPAQFVAFERVEAVSTAAGPTLERGTVPGQAATEPDRYVPLPRGGVAGSPPDERPAAVAVAQPIAKPAPRAPATPTYSGRNHVWMPSLGINRTVYSYPCSRTQAPDNLVYRWGCAGTNNVYLLGHAYGVFKPLHDAYYNGKLRVGMVVYYADPNGRVRRYKVTTWRVVRPEDSSWAIASQPVPSMTLQTCVGANSEYRLNVRLVAG